MTDQPYEPGYPVDSAEPVEPQPVNPPVEPKPDLFPEQPWIPVHPAYLWFDNTERVMAGAVFLVVLAVVGAIATETVVLHWVAGHGRGLIGMLWWFIALFLFLAPPAAGAGWYALDRIASSIPRAVLAVALGATMLFWLRVLIERGANGGAIASALFNLTVPFLLWWLARRIALDHAVEPAVVGRKVWDEPRRSLAYGLGSVLRVPTARLLHGVAAPVPNRVRSGRGTYAYARAVSDPVVADAAVVAGCRVAVVWLVRTEPGALEIDAYGHLFPSVHGIPRGRVSAADVLPYFERALPGARVRAFVGLYAAGGEGLELVAPDDSAVRYDTAERIAGHIATWLAEGGAETSYIDRELLADALSLWSTFPMPATEPVLDGDGELPPAAPGQNARRTTRHGPPGPRHGTAPVGSGTNGDQPPPS
jgi:hypothetical protein